MKLTERDKTLLFILGVLLVLCIPYFFVVRPFGDKKMQLQNEVRDLQSRKDQLEDLNLKREEFVAETKKAKEEEEKLVRRFPETLPQEGNILFLHNTEEKIPITLSQVAFEEEEFLSLSQNAGTGEGAGTESGGVTAGVAGTESGSGAVEAAGTDGSETEGTDGTAGTSLTGSYTQSQIIYSANYENFKDFLAYIQKNPERMVISDLNAVYSADMNIVTGNLVLKQYALKGTGREPEPVKEPELLHGTSNVFMQALGINGKTEGSEEGEADFFLMLSQPEADVEPVIFGQSMDGTGRTHLTSDANEVQEMAVSFKGSDGAYKANYQIGDEKYTDKEGISEENAEGISFDKEGNIVFEVISSPRVGDNDKVGTSLDIINKTDRQVVVIVKNDDGENPRVRIASQTGDITVR